MIQTVLILGATSDIGLAIAKKFASLKYNLILAGRNGDLLTEVKKDLEIRYGVSVTSVFFDAAAFETHHQFYENLEKKPDIAVAVFGYLGNQTRAESTWQESYGILSVNFVGAVSILNVISKDFESRKSGRIIGISSVAGDRGRASNYIYGSAKAGFTTFLSGLRQRLQKSGVTVLTVKPGFVKTKMLKGISTPGLLTSIPDQVAGHIVKNFRKSGVLYTPGYWFFIMLIIRLIPETLFKKLST